jgi:hypothetical protein
MPTASMFQPPCATPSARWTRCSTTGWATSTTATAQRATASCDRRPGYGWHVPPQRPGRNLARPDRAAPASAGDAGIAEGLAAAPMARVPSPARGPVSNSPLMDADAPGGQIECVEASTQGSRSRERPGTRRPARDTRGLVRWRRTPLQGAVINALAKTDGIELTVFAGQGRTGFSHADASPDVEAPVLRLTNVYGSRRRLPFAYAHGWSKMLRGSTSSSRRSRHAIS